MDEIEQALIDSKSGLKSWDVVKPILRMPGV